MTVIRPTRLLGHLADHARLNRRPPPVIEFNDPIIALEFANMIAHDLGDPQYFGNKGIEMHDSGRPIWLLGTFDGVKIIAPRPKLCQHSVDGWRDHFGPLADIWS